MNQEIVSAQVVLQPVSPSTQQQVTSEFSRAGFAVGPLFANNFSITGPAQLFADYFQTHSHAAPAADAPQFSPHALPSSIRDHVREILTTRPPDFGPGGDF